MEDRKKRKIPQRTCIACRKTGDKSSMIHITCYEGRLMLDRDGRAMGRGAYICRNPICIEEVWKRNLLKRAFRRELDRENLEDIKREIILQGEDRPKDGKE